MLTVHRRVATLLLATAFLFQTSTQRSDAGDVRAEPIDLLARIDVQRDAIAGSFGMPDGELVIAPGRKNILQIPVEPPAQYQLKLVAQREGEARDLIIALVAGKRQTTVMLDAFKATRSGLNVVDNASSVRNVTTYHKAVFEPDKAMEIVCTVHKSHIHVTVDGQTVIDWTGDPRRLSLSDSWHPNLPTNRIMLGSYGAGFRISKLELSPIISSGFDKLSIQDLKPEASDSVMLIEHELGSGTGFVAGHGLVVTNHHVVQIALSSDLKLHMPQQREPLSVKRIVYVDADRDLAVLEVDTAQQPLPIAYDGSFPKGEKVRLYGNPSLGDGVVLRNASVEGTVKAMVRMGGADFYQLDAEVNPGSSGGPILNSLGQVVAVVSMKATDEGERLFREGIQRFDDTGADGGKGREKGVAFGIPGYDLVNALETVRTQSNEAAARAAELYVARVVHQRLVNLAALYMTQALINVSDEVRRQAAEAKKAGREGIALPPDDDIETLRDMMRSEQVIRTAAFLERDLEKLIKQEIRSSAGVPLAVKRDLFALHQKLETIKGFAQRPGRSYDDFSRVMQRYQRELMDLMTKIRDQL